MKTLQQIKNEYAVKWNFEHWIDLLECNSGLEFEIDRHINELLTLVQKECLKNASDKANLDKYNCDRFGHRYYNGTTDGVSLENGSLYEVNKKSITDENNIIK